MGRAAAFCAHQLLYYCKHRSIKFVVIDDARVVGVALAAKAAVLVYAFLSLFTNVFGHKGYMEVVVPTGAANVWAQGYASGNRSAMPADMCDGGAAYDFVYDSSWSYLNNRCRPFAYGEVVRKKDDGVYIQTYTTDGFVAQAGCSVDAASCTSSSSAWQARARAPERSPSLSLSDGERAAELLGARRRRRQPRRRPHVLHVDGVHGAQPARGAQAV